MTNEDRNRLYQAKTFLCREGTVLNAARKLEEANRHLLGFQWSCPAEVNVTSGVGLVMQGLLEQAQQDADDAWLLIDQVASGNETAGVMASPDVEPEPDEPPADEPTAIEAFQALVREHIDHAIAKHPVFAHEFCDPCADYASEAAGLWMKVEQQVGYGNVYADSLLLEEVYEFLAEVQAGNLATAKEEAGDVAAVLYRMIQMMEERK